jgi:hypothetical protein
MCAQSREYAEVVQVVLWNRQTQHGLPQTLFFVEKDPAAEATEAPQS